MTTKLHSESFRSSSIIITASFMLIILEERGVLCQVTRKTSLTLQKIMQWQQRFINCKRLSSLSCGTLHTATSRNMQQAGQALSATCWHFITVLMKGYHPVMLNLVFLSVCPAECFQHFIFFILQISSNISLLSVHLCKPTYCVLDALPDQQRLTQWPHCLHVSYFF